MGYSQTMGFAELVQEGSVQLRAAVEYQLTANHYPPVPRSMIAPCLMAIHACNEGNYNAQIELPDGITWRGQTTAPAAQIVEGHHLEPFCDQDED